MQLKGLVFPTETAFRTPYGGKVQAQAQMRGQAEPSRMGDALTVTEQHLGWVPEFAVCFHHGGRLTEGEQTRNVGKGDGADDPRALEEAEPRPLERQHDRHQLIRRANVGDIRRSQYPEFLGERLENNLCGKLLLQDPGFRRRQVPTMQ